ncbi:MAG: tRNA pseudouridine(38-40) synthase TruA [Tannerella sp.]|jgi:tRNA pseudouridine38-40 synthase|nr:tRNA pseudouridine(38-40) synthase TruA [Tannerella sp.]
MNRYFIYLSYNGTRYCGWQRQPNGMSVQQIIEEAMTTILRCEIALLGAGRTDAGVHARTMVAHFDVKEAIASPEHIVDKLNRMLPHDIAIDKIMRVGDDAHARFDALSRTYMYFVSERKNPFAYEWICRMSLHNLDFEAMNEACNVLKEYVDFTSFSKLHTDVKTNICRIHTARWDKIEDGWVFKISADRFLRNMVRAIVGTLFELGKGKITIADFRRIIEAKDRCKAGTSAPAEGLALVEIEYPSNIFVT